MRVQKLSFYTPRVVVSDLEEERGIGVLDEASQYLDCLKKNFCNVFGVPPSHSLLCGSPQSFTGTYHLLTSGQKLPRFHRDEYHELEFHELEDHEFWVLSW